MALSETGKLIVSIAGCIAALNSFLGIGLVVHLFFTFALFRRVGPRLVFYLSISDFIWIGSVFFGMLYTFFTDTIPWFPCVTSAFFLQWFIVSTDFWVVYISIFMYVKIVHNKERILHEVAAHCICWGVPFFIACLPVVHWEGTSYGMAGTWCWIEQPSYRLLFSYAFAWSAFALISIFYFLTCYHIWMSGRRLRKYSKVGRHMKHERRRLKENKRYFRKLSAFPFIFCMQWIPATINRTWQALNGGNSPWPIVTIHIFVTLSGGSINSVLYGVLVRHSVRRKFLGSLRRIFFGSKKSRRRKMEIRIAKMEMERRKAEKSGMSRRSPSFPLPSSSSGDSPPRQGDGDGDRDGDRDGKGPIADMNGDSRSSLPPTNAPSFAESLVRFAYGESHRKPGGRVQDPFDEGSERSDDDDFDEETSSTVSRELNATVSGSDSASGNGGVAESGSGVPSHVLSGFPQVDSDSDEDGRFRSRNMIGTPGSDGEEEGEEEDDIFWYFNTSASKNVLEMEKDEQKAGLLENAEQKESSSVDLEDVGEV